MKYQNVTVTYIDANNKVQNKNDGANICIYSKIGEPAIWNHTVTATGTNTTWKEMNLIFKAPESGEANIGLRLGFFNCEAKGTVWFDNIKVEPVSSDYVYQAGHINAYFDASDTQYTIRDEVTNWLSGLDKVYLLMKEFAGNRIPFTSDKMGIVSTNAHPEGAACAGYSIYWFKGDENPIADQLLRTKTTGDLSFPILHEIGHNFNQVGKTNWNWNDEMFANFRAYYAVEQLENMSLNKIGSKPVVYAGNILRYGTQLKNYYFERYNETMAKGVFHHDGLMYKLIQAKELVGWDPFIKTLQFLSANDYSNKNDLEKLENFYSTLATFLQQPVINLISNDDMSIIKSYWNTNHTLFTR